MKLSDFASNTYSQFGEDGMIAEVFRRIGIGERACCVEFGAADGISCSNTAQLWKHDGWRAVLIETDPDLYDSVVSATEDYLWVTPVHMAVAPTGENSIDTLLAQLGITEVDFMSIDVDGDDYAIFEAMEVRPRVVCIEYNQSIPPQVELRQADVGDEFGASAAYLCALARAKDYELVGVTETNLIFVNSLYLIAFEDLNTDLETLFDYSHLTYVVTDYQGRSATLGTPPWGWHPYHESYIRETVGPDLARMPRDPRMLFDTYRRVYAGEHVFLTWRNITLIEQRPEYDPKGELADFLGPALVGIDVSNIGAHELHLIEWVRDFATEHGYRCRMDPGLITLIRE